MTHQVFNVPPQQPLSASGRILAGAKAYFYLTTTVTPTPVYTTSARNVAHAQPVVADSGGRFAAIYLDPEITYKVTVTDANDVLLYTVDPVNDVILSQSIIGQYLYPITAGEIAGGVTAGEIEDYSKPPGDDRRYGTVMDGVTLDTTPVQTAFDVFDVSDVYSYSVFLSDGPRLVENLEVHNRNCIRGASLEGTRLEAASGITGIFVNDSGNAAKIEMYNITIDGNSEAGITSGLRLGVDNIQFGTYGTLDNIMVRDMPNATAFDIDGNALVLGKLYSLTTENGYISHVNGSGTHIESYTPYDFTGIGLSLAKADSVNFVEAEAPGADTAKPLIYERGGFVLNYYLSIGPNRTVRTPVQINTTHVGHWALGPTVVNFAQSTSRYGDTTNPNESGTASSGGANTLTDTTKTWTRDQWVDAALHITGGTGSGQFQRVESNSKDTLTTKGSWVTPPDNTSTYEMSYFIRKSTDAGLQTGTTDGWGHSDSFTAYWPWFQRVSVGERLATETLVVGKSNHSVALQGIMKVTATLDFASVSANSVGTPLTVTVAGAQAGMPVILGIPDAIASTGIVFTPCVSAANTVTIYPKNITGSPIDLGSTSYVVTVLDYA